jgi:hypothetical protein
MSNELANDFYEILPALQQNAELRATVINLINSGNVVGKSTEGDNRLDQLRAILRDLANNEINLSTAYSRVEQDLPWGGSIHSYNNRVFPSDWGERLVRTQLSRFYNQAVAEMLLAEGATECFVPHSGAEDANSKC